MLLLKQFLCQYCHVYERDSRRGLGLDIGPTDHSNTKPAATLNHSAIANFHILQITKSLPQSAVPPPDPSPRQRPAIMAILPLPRSSQLRTAAPFHLSILAKIVPLSPSHGPSRKPFQTVPLLLHKRIRCRGNVFTEPLPKNGSGIFAYLAVVA
jgi:hypothetical protein